jgi:hypothetical protein
MEQMLISNARLLRLPNDYGIKKMMRNMLALQQSIKTLTNDQRNTEFKRAKKYYSLYYLTPQVCCSSYLVCESKSLTSRPVGYAWQHPRKADIHF